VARLLARSFCGQWFPEQNVVRDATQNWLISLQEHEEFVIKRVNVGVNSSPGAVGEGNLVIHDFKSSRSSKLC
jgi:hypothetical protein